MATSSFVMSCPCCTPPICACPKTPTSLVATLLSVKDSFGVDNCFTSPFSGCATDFRSLIGVGIGLAYDPAGPSGRGWYGSFTYMTAFAPCGTIAWDTEVFFNCVPGHYSLDLACPGSSDGGGATSTTCMDVPPGMPFEVDFTFSEGVCCNDGTCIATWKVTG